MINLTPKLSIIYLLRGKNNSGHPVRLWHLFTSNLAVVLMFAALASAGYGQSQMNCGDAVSQLQAYVQQVNNVANFEYYRGIPSRCGMNAYCGNAQLQQLNYWYAQQSMLVNQWYSTIARACTEKASAPKRKVQKDPTEEIADVDDLQVDDEDKTVRIKIPSKPSGYNR